MRGYYGNFESIDWIDYQEEAHQFCESMEAPKNVLLKAYKVSVIVSSSISIIDKLVPLGLLVSDYF